MALNLTVMNNNELIEYRDEIVRKMGDISIPNLGAKRKALVEHFGFDTKAASHLIRLLRMGIEFLTDGELQVTRHVDGPQLLEIKRGEWTLDQVKAEADRLFKLSEKTYIKSKLSF